MKKFKNDPAKKKNNKRNRLKKRGNSRYIVLFLFLAVALIILGNLAFHFAKQMDFFKINHIVVTGNQNLNESFIEEMAYEYIGQNLFSVSKQSLEEKYINIVRVKDTKVSRRIPNKLIINITERLGVIYIKTSEGKLIPIDEQMVVLDNKGFFLNEDLPIVQTDISSDLLIPGTTMEKELISEVMKVHALINKSMINAESISEYYFENDNLHLIEANTATRICLGREPYQDNLNKLEFMWSNLGIENNKYIDLRFNNQVVIKDR